MERALHGVNTIDEPRLRECTYQLFASLAQLYEVSKRIRAICTVVAGSPSFLSLSSGVHAADRVWAVPAAGRAVAA